VKTPKLQLIDIILIYLIVVSIVFSFMYANLDDTEEIDIPTEQPTIEVIEPIEEVVESPEIVEPTETIEESIVEKPVMYFDVPLDRDLQDYIFELCGQYEIDPALVMGVIYRESSFRTYVMGDNGRSYGLMQIQLRYQHERMAELNCTDLLDPYQNVLVGIDILDELFERGKSVEWVLMSYNGGCTYANKKEAAGVVSGYAKRVLEASKSFNMVAG